MCGACWAFVATASVEAQVRIAGGKQIPLSVQELIDCDTALNRLVIWGRGGEGRGERIIKEKDGRKE